MSASVVKRATVVVIVAVIVGTVGVYGAANRTRAKVAPTSLPVAIIASPDAAANMRKEGAATLSVRTPLTSGGGAAVHAFLQAFWSRNSDRENSFPRTNGARDAIYPFYPDTSDASPENIALIEQRAREGSDIALGAYLLVAAGASNYTATSLDLLQINAARGSVLALTTLASYATIGYGFERADPEAALLYEYLAWRTGYWNNSFAFVPTLVKGWSTAQCLRAMVIADSHVIGSEMFPGIPADDAPNCRQPEVIRDLTE